MLSNLKFKVQNSRLLLVLVFSFFILNFAFADEAPRFYGDEVVVTATRQPQLASSVPWDTSIVGAQELKNYKTVGEALRAVAGVDAQAFGSLGALNSVRLRGANASQVLIMVDGRRINSPTLGMVDLGDLLVDNVEKIEIVRAPLSAIYGSDAVAGVINIITKTPKEAERSLFIADGSFGMQQYKFSVGNDNYYLSGDYLRSDGFRTNGDYLAQNLYGKLNFPTLIGELQADYNYYNAAKGVPGLPLSAADPASASTPDNRQADRNTLASIGLKADNYLLKAYQNYLDQTSDYFSIYGASTYETLTLQTGIDWQQKIVFGLGDVLYGLEYREDRGKAPGMGEPSIRNGAAFVQDQIQLSDRYALTASVRGDKQSGVGTSVNPRLGIIYQPPGGITVKASAGTAFRAPTLNDLYYNDGYSSGDPNLKPERSFSYELGLERQLSQNTMARLNYFVNATNDMIFWPQVATYEYHAVNMGQARCEGLEFELERKLGENGKGFINYTYQKSIIEEGVDPAVVGGTVINKITPFTPQGKLNIGIFMADVSLLVKYVGERYVDLQNQFKLAGYTVVDLSLSKKTGSAQVSLSVNNLFDEIYYEAAQLNAQADQALTYPMPRRSYSLGVKWEW